MIVFKFPGNAKQNYIKRLVGLPNEMVRVQGGNVYATPRLFYLPLGRQGAAGARSFDRRGSRHLRIAWPHAGRLTPASHNLMSVHTMWTPRPISLGRLELQSGAQRFLISEHDEKLHVFDANFQVLRKPADKVLAMFAVCPRLELCAPPASSGGLAAALAGSELYERRLRKKRARSLPPPMALPG